MTESIGGVQQGYKAGANFDMMYNQNQINGADGVSVSKTTLPQYDNSTTINFQHAQNEKVPQHANSDLFQSETHKLDVWV